MDINNKFMDSLYQVADMLGIDKSILDDSTPSNLEEAANFKWNTGSDKSNLTFEEMQLLEKLAEKLMLNSPNNYKYDVRFTYEDYGAGMRWYNIICYDKRGNSWQVLNTKEWLDLMNTKDIDSIYNSIVNDEYFQDKQKDIKNMNYGELFNSLEDIEE